MPQRRSKRLKSSHTPYRPPPSGGVDSLVDDTLRIIFEYCSLTRGRAASAERNWIDRVTFFEPREVLKICLVSQRWNRVVRDHAVLWTHIHIQHSQLAQLQFKLSKNAPLQIIYGYGSASTVCGHVQMGRMSLKTVYTIEANMHRVELLSFSANSKMLPHLVSMHYLMPVLFSTPAPQLKSWHMLMHDWHSEDPGKFDKLLYSPFRDQVLGVRNIHWENYKPNEPHRLLNGLTNLVVWDMVQYGVPEIELLTILRSNPSLEELNIPSVCYTLGPISRTDFVMESLKSLRLAFIYHDHLETLLHKVSLPVIQDIDLGIHQHANEQHPPIVSLHDTFLGCPDLRNLFSIPQSLSFNTELFLRPDCVRLRVHTNRATLPPEVCVLINKSPFTGSSANLFCHFLEMFPNLNRLHMPVAPGYLFTAVNMGTSPGINTLSLDRPHGEHLKALNVHTSLPSLAHLILQEPVLEDDDDWKAALDLLPESELQMTCTVRSPTCRKPSDEILEEMSKRNIHLHMYPYQAPFRSCTLV